MQHLLFMIFPARRSVVHVKANSGNIISDIGCAPDYRISVECPRFSFVFAKWTYKACNISSDKQRFAQSIRCFSIAFRRLSRACSCESRYGIMTFAAWKNDITYCAVKARKRCDRHTDNGIVKESRIIVLFDN